MGNTLATMLTMTTYGTWLRGDNRGWVEDGIILPRRPRPRIRRPPPHEALSCISSRDDRLLDIGTFIGESLIDALERPNPRAPRRHLARRTSSSAPRTTHIAEVAKCAKDAVRYGLRPGRPIWTDGYDKRFCFDDRTALARIRYVERHNEALGLPARPWPFITPFRTHAFHSPPHLTHLAPGQ